MRGPKPKYTIELTTEEERELRKWRRRWAKKRSIEDVPRPGAPRRFSP
jgi:hypothetical protein